MTIRYTFACLAALAVAATSSLQVGLRADRAANQAPTLQAALAADAAQMGEKFAGLARVMDGKYDWRPGQGVRAGPDARTRGHDQRGPAPGDPHPRVGRVGRPDASDDGDGTRLHVAVTRSRARARRSPPGCC